MLDLTYLYQDEPIEPDDLIILDKLPHWLFQRELKKTLADHGYTWDGTCATEEYSFPDHGVMAVMQVGTSWRVSTTPTRMAEFTLASMTNSLRFFRYGSYEYECKFSSYTVSNRGQTIWFKILFTKWTG